MSKNAKKSLKEERSMLSVMESLAGSADLPQRKIAARTGLNLAKVNYVLKKLVDKGFVKLQHVRGNPNKIKYLYVLTPAGAMEKSRLAYRFLRRTLRNYRKAEIKIKEAVESMTKRGVHNVVLWGNNEITEVCLELIEREKRSIKIVGVVDPEGRYPGSISLSKLSSIGVGAILVCDSEANGIPSGIPAWRLA